MKTKMKFLLMRKFYVLMVLPFIFACSHENDVLDSATNSSAEILTPKNTRAASGEYRMLGFSYDITRESLDKESYRRLVIDVEKLATESRLSIITNPETGGRNYYYYGYNSSEYLKDITTKSGFSATVSGSELTKAGSLKGFSGNISNNSDLSTKYSYSTKFSFASVDVSKYVNSLRIEETPSFLSGYVTDKFIRDLEELTADEFVAAYGTHVLTDITLGGVLRVLYRSSIIDEMSTSTKTNTLKAGFNASLGKIGLGMAIDESATITETQVNKNIEKTIFILYKSGEGVDVIFDERIDKYYPTINKYSWEQSVNKSNAGLVNVNWANTLPIYDFIPQSHSYKKQAIKDAVKNYIERNQILPLELTPVYQWYRSSGGTYAYGTNSTQVHGSGYTCQGVAFWVPKYSSNETIPVYQWYRSSGGLYAYGTNTTQVHGSGYICHGAAFNTPNPTTFNPDLIPIYQWYRPSGGLYAYGSNTTEVHGPGYICHGRAFWAYK